MKSLVSRWAYNYVAEMRRRFDFPSPVLNVGAGDAVSNRFYLPIYQDLEHYNLDIQPEIGIDIVANCMDMPEVKSESYGTVLCADTLEHIEHPWEAMLEFNRILKPSGLFVATTCCCYGIHRLLLLEDRIPGHPPVASGTFNDYWRFCPDGLRVLFRDAEFKVLNMRGNMRIPGKEIWEDIDFTGQSIGEGGNELQILNIAATGRK